MKIPSYNYIEITQYDPSFKIKDEIISKAESCPIVINLQKLKLFEAEEFIVNIEYELKQLKISPLYPYPIYVVTQHKIQSNYLPILSNMSDLPPLYKVKNGLLKKNDIFLLNKIECLKDKISHSSSMEKISKIKNILHNAKQLKSICDETNTYIKIMEKMNHNERTQK